MRFYVNFLSRSNDWVGRQLADDVGTAKCCHGEGVDKRASLPLWLIALSV